MATNKFATMLSRKTNKITVILVYAFLEWLLIFFLFLNSLFTYLLAKFASFFGLKQPCLFCPKLDRIFEPNPETRFTYKELICENHAAELSSLSFCKNHGKLAESTKMCSDCSDRDGDNSLQRNIGFRSCPCCQKSLAEKPYPSYLLLKSSSWGDALGFKENGGLILEMIDDDKMGEGFEKERESDHSGFCNEAAESKGQEQHSGEVISDVESYGLSLREVSEEDGLRSVSTNFPGNEDEISEIHPFSGQFCSRKDDDSVEIIDLSDRETVARDPGRRLIPVELIDSFTITNQGDINSKEENKAAEQNYDTGSVPKDGEDKIPAREEETDRADLLDDQSGTKKLIIEEFSDKAEEEEGSYIVENVSGAVDPLLAGRENEMKEEEEEEEEEEKILERMEEKLPETPTSADTLNSLHKKMLFDKREIGAEESVDESIVSEMDGGDPFQTIERLRAAVQAEREALRALYAELEEERSASAIAANQTMAMITRLQEEKAKMQMEALQYQRMMEEQSEYDQEALQLLNDLMVKREKEKEELQKELEVYRKKVLEYETKEKTKIATKTSDDEQSTDDLDEKNEDDEAQNNSSETAVDLEEITLDCVKHISMLDESLTEFEEERLAILDQLKVLEEKLLTMQENEFTENLKSESYEVNSDPEGNQDSHGFTERLTMASMAKSLLPLLDAAENETEDEYREEPESVERNLELDDKKIEIIEQVDSVYERLQALETDGEFLKHCMTSVKKGDKGTDILQEILQHLRDLRTIELHER